VQCTPVGYSSWLLYPWRELVCVQDPSITRYADNVLEVRTYLLQQHDYYRLIFGFTFSRQQVSLTGIHIICSTNDNNT
jgi:hypothetical protein